MNFKMLFPLFLLFLLNLEASEQPVHVARQRSMQMGAPRERSPEVEKKREVGMRKIWEKRTPEEQKKVWAAVHAKTRQQEIKKLTAESKKQLAKEQEQTKAKIAALKQEQKEYKKATTAAKVKSQQAVKQRLTRAASKLEKAKKEQCQDLDWCKNIKSNQDNQVPCQFKMKDGKTTEGKCRYNRFKASQCCAKVL